MYGKEIKQARINAGLSQKKVESITGIAQNTISWIESDSGIPNVHMCVLLAQCYGITLEDLLGLEDENGEKVSRNEH